MIVILEVIRFLLLQAHAFFGDKNVAYLLHNNQMTSPYIQKDLCKACAEQTNKAIIQDIGDRNFSILVDEARDASIKEQMAVILRYLNARVQVIERFIGVK